MQPLKFLATDMPNMTSIYRDRYQTLQKIFPEGSNKHVEVIPVTVYKDAQHLKDSLRGVPAESTLVLKNPMSHYHPGKTGFDIITISVSTIVIAC